MVVARVCLPSRQSLICTHGMCFSFMMFRARCRVVSSMPISSCMTPINVRLTRPSLLIGLMNATMFIERRLHTNTPNRGLACADAEPLAAKYSDVDRTESSARGRGRSPRLPHASQSDVSGGNTCSIGDGPSWIPGCCNALQRERHRRPSVRPRRGHRNLRSSCSGDCRCCGSDCVRGVETIDSPDDPFIRGLKLQHTTAPLLGERRQLVDEVHKFL